MIVSEKSVSIRTGVVISVVMIQKIRNVSMGIVALPTVLKRAVPIETVAVNLAS